MISTFPWKNGSRFFIPGVLLLATLAITPVVAQQGDYNSESLFIALFANGDALVEYDVSIKDPLDNEIMINLFGGTHINDLIVVDYEDTLVKYNIGDAPNRIVLNTPGVENVRISYTTPDLADRTLGIWRFSINATTGFSVRLPPDSVLVDYEPFPTTIKIINDKQPLLTFDEPGDIRVSYAIGVLGTEDQANIAVQIANAAIREARASHPDIALADAQELLDRATVAKDERRFADAESLAGQANDAAVAADKNYVAAQTAITDADSKIHQAANEGRDVEVARQLLEQAKTEFAAGNYVEARNSAEEGADAIRDRPQVPVAAIIAGAAAAASGVGALLFIKKRKQPSPQVQRESPRVPGNSIKPTTAVRSPAERKEEMEEPGKEPLEANSMPIEPGTIPDSQIDKSVLGGIVGKILEERTHLRPEDQEVLRFLAEKEGAAFESEIRTKFQLPKTTIWRLVKRLEREELVEIRKAGGQNLIKLKFEDKLS